ncbi:YtcA family lipoprotein [Ramlibacter tataouinensis]|uniref:Uncharacterized protein YtcA n=1 Tax=Ramlibacter tataouinensis TaxID=94132 RepID=A0A127K049_9BURK|nr:YtcA family lipoprotein [Ramlibacter tataouinensis]AMO25493.1 hypothetical protein UC35_15865 [Ramlibacter tataouinensis]
MNVAHALRCTALAAAVLCIACTGAPTLEVAGAYFPAWLASSLVGVVIAFAARAVFVATGLAQLLPLQLFVCASIGLMAGLLAWLLWMGW